MLRRLLLVALPLAVLAACGDDLPPSPGPEPPPGVGLSSTSTRRTPEQALDRVEAKLEKDRSQSIVTRVDVADDARQVDVRLEPVETIVFGDPAVMVPLLQRNQLAALDLPLSLTAFDEGEGGSTELVHATPEYLAERYGLQGASELDRTGDTFRELVEEAGGEGVTPRIDEGRPALGDGIVVRRAEGDVDEVADRVERAAEAAQLDVVDVVDHTRDTGGEPLRPTTVVLVSGPRLETPLLGRKSAVAVDLPQRIVVYEDAGGDTRLAYADPAYTARRHRVPGEERAVRRLTERLEVLSGEAAG